MAIGLDEAAAGRLEIGHDDEELRLERQVVAGERLVLELAGDAFGQFGFALGLAPVLAPAEEQGQRVVAPVQVLAELALVGDVDGLIEEAEVTSTPLCDATSSVSICQDGTTGRVEVVG